MIKIRDKGNTSIQIATKGVEVKGGTQWTVFPYYRVDPTLQRFSNEERKEIQELSITDFREKDDLEGHKMKEAMAEAIARLRQTLELEQYKDLVL
jgi:hypothetical protein